MNWNRSGPIMLMLAALSLAPPAQAQLSVEAQGPGIDIGINVPVYPQLVAVPGYPVYYAPRLNANYFFYDGMYWVYRGDDWFASSWYNGPWERVAPEAVPVYVLQVPVRYYRRPPEYFHGWRRDAAPRWGEHWGHAWEQGRHGWERRDHRGPAAPLPAYQRRYGGDHYPQMQQQRELHERNYRYQPNDKFVREHYPQRPNHAAPPAHESNGRHGSAPQAHDGGSAHRGQAPGAGPSRERGEDRRQEHNR